MKKHWIWSEHVLPSPKSVFKTKAFSTVLKRVLRLVTASGREPVQLKVTARYKQIE